MFNLETDSEFPIILNRLIQEANKSEEYTYLWRGMIDGEEYKISIQTDDFSVTNINIKFRGKLRVIDNEEIL